MVDDPHLAVALRKLERARKHAAELAAEIAAWTERAKGHVTITPLDDRHTIEMRMSLAEPIPLDSWAMILGDCLHNARSALDAVVWSYVDEEQLTEGQKRRIQWPVVTDASKWPDAASTSLRTVPALIVDRIRQCQPYIHADVATPTEPNALELLHQMDVIDKHRLTIAARVEQRSIEQQFSIAFDDPDSATARPDLGHTITVPDPEFEDGALVAAHHFVDAFTLQSMNGTLHFAVFVEHGGRSWFPQYLAATLIGASELTVRAIAGDPAQ